MPIEKTVETTMAAIARPRPWFRPSLLRDSTTKPRMKPSGVQQSSDATSAVIAIALDGSGSAIGTPYWGWPGWA